MTARGTFQNQLAVQSLKLPLVLQGSRSRISAQAMASAVELGNGLAPGGAWAGAQLAIELVAFHDRLGRSHPKLSVPSAVAGCLDSVARAHFCREPRPAIPPAGIVPCAGLAGFAAHS